MHHTRCSPGQTTLQLQAVVGIQQCTYQAGLRETASMLCTNHKPLSGKNESIPVPPSGDMATREMFLHAKHLLERALNSMLEKHYACAFVTVNVLNQQHMVTSFLEFARQYFREHRITVGGGELDVLRICLSLKREKNVSAHERLLKQ